MTFRKLLEYKYINWAILTACYFRATDSESKLMNDHKNLSLVKFVDHSIISNIQQHSILFQPTSMCKEIPNTGRLSFLPF